MNEPKPDTYHMSFRDMPRDLMSKAIERCQQEKPPIALKWKIIQLIEAWLEKPASRPQKRSTTKIGA